MKFVKKIRNVFVPLKETKLSDIPIMSFETIIAYNENGTVYGICGCVIPSSNRQLEFIDTKLIEKQPCLDV
jgi:hypothetical protein